MYRFLYCKKLKKIRLSILSKERDKDIFERIISENIKMDEHNSKYPQMDWDAKDLPLAFKSLKEHCNFLFGGPL